MKIRIGTRKSALALEQANSVKKHLEDYARESQIALEITLVPIITSGDKFQQCLAEIGGKDLFTKEIEDLLANKKIEIAVHSLKDIPAMFYEKSTLGAFLPREKANDAFISYKYDTINDVPPKGTIATSSFRRAIQLPKYNIIPMRGNIDTRLAKCKESNIDGMILAYAGLKRINLESHVKHIIPYKEMIPSIGQGIIAIQVLKDSENLLEILSNITHQETHICAMTERSFIETINGNCRTPVGGIAEIESENTIAFQAMLATTKGVFYAQKKAIITEAQSLGRSVAEELISKSSFKEHCYS